MPSTAGSWRSMFLRRMPTALIPAEITAPPSGMANASMPATCRVSSMLHSDGVTGSGWSAAKNWACVGSSSPRGSCWVMSPAAKLGSRTTGPPNAGWVATAVSIRTARAYWSSAALPGSQVAGAAAGQV